MCRNVHCNDTDHIDNIDDYASNIFLFLDDTSKEALPTTSGGNKKKTDAESKIVPGCTERVKPFKENAKFWHTRRINYWKLVLREKESYSQK